MFQITTKRTAGGGGMIRSETIAIDFVLNLSQDGVIIVYIRIGNYIRVHTCVNIAYVCVMHMTLICRKW